eukprot:CAMPEP_0174892566 /NCGR_PEP_ID=MMETSP0167-20121228/7498_1 /TAXON_ID=38298 /ORGANISM="Rhodella maculata, Strain CCMP736" /LENGTH=56 /DNA_ID=CAMNT_0016131095 /DNA_START=165 /DNA_END=333 /DNA_ORIENTATION=+
MEMISSSVAPVGSDAFTYANDLLNFIASALMMDALLHACDEAVTEGTLRALSQGRA